MIYNINDADLCENESYKERNLYYKIFAGYLFNELVPGNKKRKAAFIYADSLRNIPALIIYGRQDGQGESTFYLQTTFHREIRTSLFGRISRMNFIKPYCII